MTRPNFIIAGAAKSGTTSLAHYLRQHPDVFVAREKECHYFLFQGREPAFTGPGDTSEFASLIITDISRYAQCFERVAKQRAVGEASVYYLYRPEAIEAALRFDPQMKVIVVLREPAGRAFSAYSHQRRDGWETITDFAQALQAEDDRVNAGWGFGWHYRRVSDYVWQVRAAQQLLQPQQLHIALYDDLVQRPAAVVREIFEFLEVDSSVPIDTGLILNASGAPRSATLNNLLARQNKAKDILKRVVPYRVGVHVAQRTRNWNLRQEIAADPARALAVAPKDYVELGRLIGRDLGAWNASRP